MTTEPQDLTIEADGATLAARYVPPVGPARANMVIHGATGVPQRFYGAFATWAAGQGIGTLTYDYRDFGQSLHRSLRKSDTTFADWLMRDQPAAEAMLAGLAPEGPLWVLGHSLGGFGLAFRDYDPRVEKIVTVGTGRVHYTDHPWSYRPLAMAFWFGPGPAATAAAGYMPGRLIGFGADLPAGVYWQWRRWCTRREFFYSDVGRTLPEPDFHRPGPDINLFTMSDDVVVPPVAVRRYAEAFPETRATCHQLVPQDFGVAALRHIEVLSRLGAPAWPAILGLDSPEAAPMLKSA
ncbi:alpha/beta fold hydrolase [Chachezhania antarctica]|uniref:alpha/beta hydrolase family protein n=1 Tax=Chachezhania antarctica TaxID=2340860 RepID=UPI000EB409A1|nr:alpha/beta fold hydrolase [Chachezhania antarctica]|tara:strand:+ start:4574 stop:5455 length:882 start_codon:yes stop_codon:yes gene_type:complete